VSLFGKIIPSSEERYFALLPDFILGRELNFDSEDEWGSLGNFGV